MHSCFELVSKTYIEHILGEMIFFAISLCNLSEAIYRTQVIEWDP